jgi:hypothetical protein
MAQISSTFQIVFDFAASQPTLNISPGRPFKIVSIQGTGLNNATLTVSKVASGGGVTACGVVLMESAGLGVALSDQYAVMNTTLANRILTATDSVRLVVAAANATRCVLNCIAADGQTLTES